jgi:hypothetical protein
MRLAELLRLGRENDAINDKLQRWTRELLRARSLQDVPALVTEGMLEEFAVPHVALRIWGVAGAPAMAQFEAGGVHHFGEQQGLVAPAPHEGAKDPIRHPGQGGLEHPTTQLARRAATLEEQGA